MNIKKSIKKVKEIIFGFKIRGEMTFQVRDKDGNSKKLWNENTLGKILRKYFGLDLQGISFLGYWDTKMQFHNLIVSTGKAGMASRCNGAGSEAAFTYLEIGTGTTSPVAGNTTLEAAITDSGLSRASATCTRVTTSVTNDTAQLDYTWSNITGSKAVTEAGAFNNSSGGTMIGRQTFTAINVSAGDSLEITYKFQFS
ncbi:MAG: hypothetical protein PHQ46_10740 [Negativicutes bacterium]|nr:hypothetical protein [Negativicutes bacterium]